MVERTFDPPPTRMQSLPRHERWCVVPWFVALIEGQPEFRAADAGKKETAIREQRCWVCGQKLGVYKAFVLGPMCGISRIAAEPPSHVDCAEWSARNCPFLANPEHVRREDETVNAEKIRENAAGHAIVRNPGVIGVWITRQPYEIVPTAKGELILIPPATEVHWYRERRPATRVEVMEGVEAGLPFLMSDAGQDGLNMLQAQYALFMKNYLPAPELPRHQQAEAVNA